jgi:hypothetical protein
MKAFNFKRKAAMAQRKTIKTLRLFIFAFILLRLSSPLVAKDYQLTSPTLSIQIDSATGGIQSIVNKRDKYQMNWILKSDSTQYPWQTQNLAWGLGFGLVNGDTVCWNKPFSQEISDKQASFTYRTKYFELTVTHTLNNDGTLSESFQFTNTTQKPIAISEVGIYTPINDNYPDSKTCVEGRCNAHIWAGGNSSYVFAERMSGEAPHLGLVLTEGSLKSYEIQNRSINIYKSAYSSSNTRGTIVLNPADISLNPKQSYSLKWIAFEASDWNDFYAKAQAQGLVKASAKKYVIEKEEPLQVTFEAAQKLKNVQCFLNGKKVPFNQTDKSVDVTVTPKTPGEQVLSLTYNNNQSTFVKAYRIENIDSLLKKRVQFIVNHQQMNDTADARYGAYMVYDNETNAIYLNNDKRKSSDTNEGRERVGMGVFLAMYLQKHPDATIQKSLERYCRFVRYKLQRPDYSVPSSIGEKGRMRVYNYPWVAQLYLQMFKLTNNKVYLTDSYKTLRRYFIDSKYKHYAIGVPAQSTLAELKKAALNAEYDTLLTDCKKTAENYLQTSLYYPKHEVNYEQSIVAPSVTFLFEMYQITGDERYLKEGEKQLNALESFAGQQPDYHLNNIGIRHWDGFWFGKNKFWGDVMPHYWSAITSDAYARYAAITGNKEYSNRAETIVKNNLCQFFADGSASCAYLYPAKVNGKKTAFFDPFANDQDWALVYYLKVFSF